MKRLAIFLSHHSADEREAEQMKGLITTVFNGQHTVFLSTNVSPGSDWFEEVKASLHDTDITVVFTSKRALERPWVWFEVGASWLGGAVVIPLCIKGMTKSSLRDPLSRLKALNATQGDIARLMQFVAEKCRADLDAPTLKQVIRRYFPAAP